MRRQRISPLKRYLLWLQGIILVVSLVLAQKVAAQHDDYDQDEECEAALEGTVASLSSSGGGRRSIFGGSSSKKKGNVAHKHVLMVSINELSHIKPLTALGRELVKRGHQVTFVAPESCLLNNGAHDAPCLLDTKGWMETYLPGATFLGAGAALTSAEKEAAAPRDLGRAVLYALQTVADVNEALLARLLETFAPAGNHTAAATTTLLPAPDIMVVDFLTTAAVDAAEALKIPLMVNNPFPICHDLTEPQGILVPVHAFPAPLRSLKTFKGRVANLINHFLWLGVGLYAARLRNLTRARHGLPALPYLEQLSFRANAVESRAWILQNTVFGLEVPRVIDPRTHMVGPLMIAAGGETCTSGRPQKDCKAAEKWLGKKESKQRPVIYVNLAEPLAQAPIQMVLATIKALASDQIGEHFDVLWALDEASRLRLDRPVPPHMLVVTAVNPMSVLANPRVKVAMSQSSLDAVSAALWHGVPVLGLPLRGYDRGACTLAQDAGAAVCMLPSGRRGWAMPENLVEAVLELAPLNKKKSSSEYQENAKRLGKIMLAAGGVPRAADLVELGMRVGLVHLQQPKLDLGLGMGTSWLSGSMVDVRLVLFFIILLCYWTLALLYRLVRRLLFRWSRYQQRESKEGNGGVPTTSSSSSSFSSTSHSPYSGPPHSGGGLSSMAPLLPNPIALSPSTSAPNVMMAGGGGDGERERPPRDRPSPTYQRNNSGGGGFGSGGGGNGGGSSGRDRPPLPTGRPSPNH